MLIDLSKFLDNTNINDSCPSKDVDEYLINFKAKIYLSWTFRQFIIILLISLESVSFFTRIMIFNLLNRKIFIHHIKTKKNRIAEEVKIN